MIVTFISPLYKNIWESVGIGSIISYCKKNYNGHIEFRFFHENFDRLSVIMNSIYSSDIIAFSATTPTFERCISIARLSKIIKPNVKTVFGGWHVTVKKEIEYPKYMDHIIVGEGETGFLSILNGNEDKVIIGNMLEFEDIPWPDREIINQRRQLDFCEKTFGERIASFQSRRGCSHSCSFCAEKHMSHNNVRVRDSIDTMNEIEYVDKMYGITKFKFLDATWAYPKNAVYDFCNEKLNRNNILPFEAMAHAAYLDRDILEILKRSNCIQLSIGLEAGDPELLKSIKKGVTVEKIKKVFEISKEVGIQTRAFFMIGMPGETNESIENTKKLIREIKPDVFGLTLLTPFPGSDYYSDKYKYIDWSECDEYTNSFWETENFTNKELRDTQKSFYKEFSDIAIHSDKIK